MRSFSKKLAFVLAAAMVVTAFAPAAKAEAAKEMAINKSSQILYVNEGINHKGGEVAAPGKGNVSVYDFSVKNKPADWKTAYTFKWSSDNEDVVSVAKGGVATAVGVGKANVYCKVIEKATNEVTTLKTKVTVKANAYKVEISNADKFDGAVVEAGDVVDLNRTMYDEDNNKTTKRGTLVTDYTKWVASPSAGVEIDQKTGKFTFTEAAEAGSYELSCYTYQSSKYTEPTAKSEAVKVELVKETNFDVKQDSVKKLTLTFNTNMTGLVTTDVTVDKMVGDYAYVQQVKKVTVAEDGMSAVVEVFNNFADKANYVVKVKGCEDVAFVASVGVPVRMELVAKDKTPAYILTTGADAEIVALFFDENGVDVTEADNYAAAVTMKLEKSDANYSFNKKNGAWLLVIRKNTASATVIANYRGRFENGKIVGALEAKQEFMAVDAPAIYPTGVKVYDLDQDWYNQVTHSLQMKDTAKKLWIQLDLSNGKDVKYTTLGGNTLNSAAFDLNKNERNERITVTAITPDVADLVNGVVRPHKPGVALFYVNYGMKVDNNWNDIPFATIEIEVLDTAYVNAVAVNESAFTVSTEDFYLVDGVSVSSYDYLFGAKNTAAISSYAGGLKPAGFGFKAFDLLGYDQRGNRIDLRNRVQDFSSGIPEVKIKCLTESYDEKYDAKDLAAWPYVSVYYTGGNYWADQNDSIGLKFDGTLVKKFLVDKGVFNKALDGEVIVLDYEVTFTTKTYAELKTYFTVTVQEPSGNPDDHYVEVRNNTYGGNVDISRYVTPYDGNGNTENTKTVSFEVFKTSNGVTIDTVAISKYNKGTATFGAYQFKILKDGVDITDKAEIVSGVQKSNGYPFDQNPSLIHTNKITLTLSGLDTNNEALKAVAATGSAVPNYYQGGVGVYTFELYTTDKDGYEVFVSQSDATVVMNGTGEYTLDNNNQRKNAVYSLNEAEMLKCFTIKKRDGSDVVVFEDGVDKIKLAGANDLYKVVWDLAPSGKNVYVKEIVFFEHLGGKEYAPYVVPVDVTLEKR